LLTVRSLCSSHRIRQFTHLPFRLLTLPVDGCGVPTVGKSRSSDALSELSCFDDLEKPRTFGAPKRSLFDATCLILQNYIML